MLRWCLNHDEPDAALPLWSVSEISFSVSISDEIWQYVASCWLCMHIGSWIYTQHATFGQHRKKCYSSEVETVDCRAILMIFHTLNESVLEEFDEKWSSSLLNFCRKLWDDWSLFVGAEIREARDYQKSWSQFNLIV